MSTESRQLIEAQISSEGLGVMNNFIIRLAPRGRTMAEIEESVARRDGRDVMNERVIHASYGTLDTSYRDFFEQDPEPSIPGYEYSDLYLDQTPRQFFEAIDRTLERLGYDTAVIADLYGNGAQQQRLYGMLTPAFLDLIEQGYTVRDLAQ